MRRYVWTEEYSVGNETIDEQHKVLIEILNDLSESYNDIENLKVYIDKLINYANFHFDMEEKIMKNHHFPYALIHSAEHEYFIDELVLFSDKIEDKTIEKIEVLDFLVNWLFTHIKKRDKELANYINM